MNISGKIKLIGETKEYGSNGFRKREIVITTQEQYPQNILIEFIQDRTSLLDTFQADDFVKIDINLRGREWTNQQGELKYFNSFNDEKNSKLINFAQYFNNFYKFCFELRLDNMIQDIKLYKY